MLTQTNRSPDAPVLHVKEVTKSTITIQWNDVRCYGSVQPSGFLINVMDMGTKISTETEFVMFRAKACALIV